MNKTQINALFKLLKEFRADSVSVVVGEELKKVNRWILSKDEKEALDIVVGVVGDCL